MLESLAHAQQRGARMYAELAGYGTSADAFHVTAPSADHEGAQRSMRSALADAGLAPHDIGYINAHATATPIGDLAEARAIEAVFGAGGGGVPVSSTKSMTGHLTVPHAARSAPLSAAMSNSFGFGGTNAALVMRAVDA